MTVKANENEWFKKHEILLITTARRARERKEKETRAKVEADEAKKLRELHWMHCPKCGHTMETVEKYDVKIDFCRACEGIFLDRGELEQILIAQDSARKSLFRSIAHALTGGKISKPDD